MDLQAYLDRIGFEGTPRVDVATLTQIQQRHLLTIPYENISVQLSEPVGLAPGPIFEKIVHGDRGGWCYEMNGLMQWALQEIGFDVMRMAGGVMRSAIGDIALGNHLVLAVQLDEVWIADVGFGDGCKAPFPLCDGTITEQGLRFSLRRLEDGFWRFGSHQFSSTTDFDFETVSADEELLEAQCHHLQSAEDSPFVATLVCQKHEPAAIQTLRGRVRSTISGAGVTRWVVDSPAELNDELAETFGIGMDLTAIWPNIVARHEAFFPDGID